MNTEWQWKRLGDVCTTSSGGTPLKDRAEYFEGGQIPWLMSGEVAQGDVTKSEKFITKLGMKNSAAKLFPVNTVLVAMYGATAGQVGVLRFEATTNQAVCGIFPSAHFIPEFLFYFLLSRKSDLVAQATGNAQPNISQGKIKETLVPLLPLEEQQQIVAVLDEAFAAIATATANAEKNRDNARELARVTLLAKTQERSKGTRKLEEVSIVDWGNTDLTKSAYVEGGSALAVSAAGCDGRIGHAEHQVGVPVLSAIGARCGRMFFPEEPFTAIKNTITITPRNGEADGKFLFHLLSSIDLPQRGAAQPFIAKGDINKFDVPFPSLEDQRSIVIEIDAMLELCDRLAASQTWRLKSLTALKQSLLHRAFTGGLTASMPENIAA